MKQEKLPVELFLIAGQSGTGKTQYVVDRLDYDNPILVLDFRGEIANKLNLPLMKSRQEILDEMKEEIPLVVYQPGWEDFEIEDDVDYFLTLAYCTHDSQIVIDEIDLELKPTEYPSSFRKLIASARTQRLTIYVTAHRLKECHIKMRALGKKIIFRIDEKSDLEYLHGLSGFDEEKIKSLPDYQYVVLPSRPDTIPVDK